MNKEWENEPNYLEWKYKGIKCEIHRHSEMKSLCGYCYYPEGHPWKESHYDDMECDVHGGLTYSDDKCISFDCAHYDDYSPGIVEYYKNSVEFCELSLDRKESLPKKESIFFKKLLKSTKRMQAMAQRDGRVYRNIEYVKKETERMADQMLTAATDKHE